MIVIHASFPVQADELDRALDHVETLVEKSNAEDGMIDYRATRDVTDEHTIRFFEQYEDEAAFEAHTQSEHFLEFAAELPEMLAGDPEVRQFEVDSATELDL